MQCKEMNIQNKNIMSQNTEITKMDKSIQELSSNSLYSTISELLKNSRNKVYNTINQTMVLTYYEIGRMIIEDEQQGKYRAEYGKQILLELSVRLTKEFGRGFSVDNLQNMRNFYLYYSLQITGYNGIEKYETLSRKSLSKGQTQSEQLQVPLFQLSWSHYLKLMRIADENERRFYEIEASTNNWSLRELQRQFDSGLYLRLAHGKDKRQILELSTKGHIIEQPKDIIKDPLMLAFLNIPEHYHYSESELEQKLIDKLGHFLLELGKGFSFVARQKRFTFDERHFYVDLVFYNRILQCFVLVDLKIGELKHENIGQMQMYVNYYDRYERLKHENKTIGIILCRDKNETLVELTLPEDNKQIFASKYLTYLPSREELIQLLENNID